MSNNWFVGKINTAPGAMPSPQPTSTPPTQAPPYNPMPQNPSYPPQTPPPSTAPTASRTASRCPSCGSGNYGASALAPEAKARCYDCGYPVVQSGSGMGTGIQSSGGGPAVPARQSTTANNFNPQGIIGHI
jgi:hypothetical protein